MNTTLDLKSLVLGIIASALVTFVIAATKSQSADILRARKLVIVDDKGNERIVIAAPVPDPVVRGKRVPRRNAATGIQINDEKGNERGGIVMLDDDSFIVGIDDEKGQERAHLYYIPKRGSGVFLQDGKEHAHASLLIPAAGDHPGRPEIELTDEAGKASVRLPAEPDTSPNAALLHR